MSKTKKVLEFIKIQISFVLAVVGIILGVILATQFNQQLPRIISPAVPFIALADMEQKLTQDQAALKVNISSEDSKIDKLSADAKGKQSNLKGLVDQVENLKIDAGITEMSGPGIIVYLADSDARRDSPNSIAHASDMRDLVDYMWQTGAKAISIEGDGGTQERVSYNTSIDCIVNTVLINGTKIVPPFKIRVIGDPQKLTDAINNKDRLKSIYERVSKEGLKFYTLDGVDTVTVKKFTGNLIFDYAQIK